MHLQVTGRGGLPFAGATTVALNLTAADPDAAGFVTAWPCDQAKPEVSNVNFKQRQTAPSAVALKLAADGTVCIYTTATTHLLADVAGYYTATRTTGLIPTIN